MMICVSGVGQGSSQTIAESLLQHSAGGWIADFQNRLCCLPELWTNAFQFANDDSENQSGDLASQRREDRDHGLHREWSRRNGGRRFWLRGWRAGASESLSGQVGGEMQYSRSRSGRSVAGLTSRARKMGR